MKEQKIKENNENTAREGKRKQRNTERKIKDRKGKDTNRKGQTIKCNNRK